MKNNLTALLGLGLLLLPACPKNEEPTETSTTVNDDVDDSTDGGDTTEGETGSEVGETTASDTTDGGFVPTTDVPAANSCDIWLQDCPEGEKCAAYAMGDTWDSTKCVPVMGDGVEGDQCTYDGALAGTDTCAVGHMCYYTNMDGVGTCIPLCTGDPENGMCPVGFNCSISNDGSLILCVYDCNPLLQDCAPEGTGCFWDGELFNCDPAGDIPEGEPCGYINDCAPGEVCLDATSFPSCAGAACCSAYCDLTDPVCLLAGTECVAFFDEGTAPPGLETVGVCAIPA
ncbi:ribulose phosphate epimerase [Nannocystaceae bacterium ST9]